MHSFYELIDRGVSFTLDNLAKVEIRVLEELNESSRTPLIKTLQMIQLQKAIIAVGMFSIFEARLQDTFSSRDGFSSAKEYLLHRGEVDLHDNFQIFIYAINVLKHGKGRSYDLLLSYQILPFQIKKLGQESFFEGDVSEVFTLIKVDDQFVLDCSDIIRKVSFSIKDDFPNL